MCLHAKNAKTFAVCVFHGRKEVKTCSACMRWFYTAGSAFSNTRGHVYGMHVVCDDDKATVHGLVSALTMARQLLVMCCCCDDSEIPGDVFVVDFLLTCIVACGGMNGSNSNKHG